MMNILKLICLVFVWCRLSGSPFILFNEGYLQEILSTHLQDDEVIKLAEEFLDAPLSTVMDKTKMPPSLSKHDYISLARYWWPNPNKPNGIPYIRKDGLTNPETFKEDYDYLRMYKMTTACKSLSFAYFLTKDERYATKAIQWIRAWFIDPKTKMNPNMKYAQGIPGKTDGRAEGIIEVWEFVELFESCKFLESSLAWNSTVKSELKEWASSYLSWLLKSNKGIQESQAANNHGTWYDVQVIYFALYTGDFVAAKQQINSKTLGRIDLQILEDGSQPKELSRKRSFHYCCFNLKGFFFCAYLAEKVGINLWAHPSVESALKWLVPYAKEESPWINEDVEPLQPKSLAHILPLAARIYSNPRYMELFHQIQQESTLYPLTR